MNLKAFFDYKGSQEVGILKGVDKNFVYVTGLDSSIISGSANFDDEVDYALLGSGMNTKLSVNPSDAFAVITAYMISNHAPSAISDISPNSN